ncbi:hypothetical protein SNEBB_003821 [Seison nebaliae]|nr:hypothetical protein SNEBB_003821 [Seison nebaliae]
MSRVLSHLFWADDLTLISRSAKGLQVLLHKLDSLCKYWGIEINTNKTKVVVFKRGGRLAKDEKWTLCNNQLEVARQFKYLGLFWSANHSWTFHRNYAISKGHQALFPLSKFYLCNQNLPVGTLVKMFHAMIQPVILYGCEIWGVRFKDLRLVTSDGSMNWSLELDRPATRFFKQLLGLPRGAPNSGVMLELATVRLHSIAIQRALSFWYRLLAKPEGHIMFDCLSHQRACMERGGKPWLFYIKNILSVIGLGHYFESPPMNKRLFNINVKMRMKDIAMADLLSEARCLRSLNYYISAKENPIKAEPYVRLPRIARRLIAITRLNLKYSLPFDTNDCCKFCSNFVESRWDHILYYCENLPPLQPGLSIVNYPLCVKTLETDIRKYPNIPRNSAAGRLYFALPFN